ncbi:four helix bundle protein [Alicyclobacillus sp. ALC3]|uniref:four helix bundle protein n=1 Tax=Alicyclobacillus sp. ALC3 TaxID=2796143 RepID=UPI00237956F4|nr:four helix bundle protein [Alicyclobacillus sp. ALC3]WDL98848.1 four helix bundle protein [Alicyclobacillus sp. ALC3]
MGNNNNVDFDTRDFRRLIAWQKAQELTVEVYRITEDYPAFERYGVVSQMQRAASSIGANIAESGVEFPKKILSFYAIAKGSASELLSWIHLSLHLSYINQKTYDMLNSRAQEVIRLLIALIRRTRNQITQSSSVTPRSRKRTLDKQKHSDYPEAKQGGSQVRDDDFDFEVEVLQWAEQSKAERLELVRKQDELRMLTSDEGRFLPDVPREEGTRYRHRRS